MNTGVPPTPLKARTGEFTPPGITSCAREKSAVDFVAFLDADDAYELLHDENTPDKYDRIDMILEDLRDYTAKHFNDEEQYMESINYKKLFTQKIQHQEFIHKLDEFIEHHNDEIKDQDEQIMGILKYLTEWLVNHILYVDGQIAEFVSKM